MVVNKYQKMSWLNMNKKTVFKSDGFKKARGGYSRWLLVSCEKCKTLILVYQKDGPGILKRLYLDRIVSSRLGVGANLACKKCKTTLGIPIIYQKEKRRAYRLFAGAVTKKVVNVDVLKRIRL